MKLYICEDYRIAKWRRFIINDKKLSLAFAKKCICDFLGEKERFVEIVFSRNEYGKPYVESIYKIKDETEKIKIDISLFFSLSHSGGMMVCAVACFNVGADCQKKNIDNIENCKKIANRFYTEKENVFLNSTEQEEYTDNFFRIWTKKEAYIKYTGKGLAEGMKTFSVTNEKRQKSYLGEVYFKRISLEKLKKIQKNNFYLYLCYNKANKSSWQIKYFN